MRRPSSVASVATVVVTAVVALATLTLGLTAPATGAATGETGSLTTPARIAGLDATTGKQRWARILGPAGTGFLSAPYMSDNVVVVTRQRCARRSTGYRAGDIAIVAIDTRTGKQLWTRADAAVAFATDLGYRSPLPIVPLTLANGDVVAVDARTGATKWTVQGLGTSETGSPIDVSAQLIGTVGDVLLRTASSSSGPPKLVALDLSTGKVRWEQAATDAAFAVYATSNGRDLFSVPERAPGQRLILTLQERSLDTGDVTASEDYPGTDGLVPNTVLVDATRVVVGVQQEPVRVVVFDRATRTEAWQSPNQLDTAIGDRVFVDVTKGPATLLALDAATGVTAWDVNAGWSASATDGRHVVLNVGTVGSDTSRATVRDLESGAQVWSRSAAPSSAARGTATRVLVGSAGCVPGAATGDGKGTDVG